MFTTVTVACECPLNFPVHSHKWIIQIMQLVALHKPVDLPPTNHTVYVISTHRHALEQLSQDCAVRLWLLNVYCTHDSC